MITIEDIKRDVNYLHSIQASILDDRLRYIKYAIIILNTKQLESELLDELDRLKYQLEIILSCVDDIPSKPHGLKNKIMCDLNVDSLKERIMLLEYVLGKITLKGIKE